MREIFHIDSAGDELRCGILDFVIDSFKKFKKMSVPGIEPGFRVP